MIHDVYLVFIMKNGICFSYNINQMFEGRWKLIDRRKCLAHSSFLAWKILWTEAVAVHGSHQEVKTTE